MKKCNLLLLAFFLLLFPVYVNGKDIKIPVIGRTLDNFSGENIGGVSLILMTSDSIPVDTTASENIQGMPFLTGRFEFFVSKKGKYIIRATSVGYNAAFADFNIKTLRLKNIRIDDIRMDKKAQELPEVLVKATKIKMIYSGDTIIYNADAFKTAEGSMLDELIRRLPGANISKDGRIMVNGRFVETLLVNGRDFFGGNAQVALRNLPAYTVSKVKVYSHDKYKIAASVHNLRDMPLTMDVNLKKEYSHGFMGNAETAIGTDNRYRMRGFGMDQKRQMRSMAYGNVNNINEERTINTSGEWKPQDIGDGVTTTKTTGVDISNILDNNDSFADISIMYGHNNKDLITKMSKQTYISGGDEIEKNDSRNSESGDMLDASGTLRFYKKRFFSDNNVKTSYHAGNSSNTINAFSYGGNMLLNEFTNLAQSNDKMFDFSLNTTNGIYLLADILRLNGNFEYARTENKNFSLYNLHYIADNLSSDRRHTYTQNNNNKISLNCQISYDYSLYSKTISPFYSFSYSHDNNNNMLYRLERLQDNDTLNISLLPSDRKILDNVLDIANSYRYRESRYEHNFGIGFTQQIKNFEIGATIPIRLVNLSLEAWRVTSQSAHRRRFFFEPSASLRFNSFNKWLYATWKYHSRIPDLTQMIDFRDDSNPLYIVTGNKFLHDIHIMDVDASLTWNFGQEKNLNASLQWSHSYNDIAMGILFNDKNGITTSCPQNVKGNWHINAELGVTMPLDKKSKWFVSATLKPSYIRSVDLASTQDNTLDDNELGKRNVVRNLGLGGRFKCDWNPSEYTQFCLASNCQWYNITGSRDNFNAINATDFDFALSATIDLPACIGRSLQVNTSMSSFFHRGYQAKEMNTTEWVWNAKLIKKLLKGRLMVSLQGFDILGQLSNRKIVINPQWRTETTSNTLGRYAMLGLTWNFLKNPKKK